MAADTALCVALDSPDLDECARLAAATCESVDMYKVGLTTFVSCGSSLVETLAAERPVFLDLKLHDIPAQVGQAVSAVAKKGVSYVTVHASGGGEMIEAAVRDADSGLQVLGVTVLTSSDAATLESTGVLGGPLEQVLRLAELSVRAGAPGLVCSAAETEALRERFGSVSEGGPLLVVPGIRPRGSPAHDQRRHAEPAEAAAAGADVIVVGRPITAAPDPGAAAAAIVEELAR